MHAYIQIEIKLADQDLIDTLIAQLTHIGFEGFEELTGQLKAFIPSTDFDRQALLAVLSAVDFSETVIEKQNWNEVWEANFEPVQVTDFVGIRAAFHEPIQGVAHEIIITPKMSFGTGHHATTYLVMQSMRDIQLQGKTVFDFGTGTGILAILAEKLGAERVLAIDNDDWCIENAEENIKINQCQHIEVAKGDNALIDFKFDCVLANINKHILLENIPYLTDSLQSGSIILLSGLLVDDESDILKSCQSAGWQHQFTKERNGWIVCQFQL